MFKLLGRFIKKWSDLLILLPASAVAFVFAESWIRKLDPTAAVLEAGTLSVLLMNLIVWACVFGGGYFLYNLYFHDFFQSNWEKGLPRWVATVVHFALWLSVTLFSFLILTRNL